ncbi:MAG: ribose-phosphate pyrophosphokinase [Patescibacteria group bacterium]|nr:ribose-phosphate pyrophosphokinase [Patescibacteria group bacterium]
MLKLFSGTANRPLTQEIAGKLGIELSGIEIVRFENSEVRVRVEEDVAHDTCVLVQPFSNPTDTNLIEFFLSGDALRREEARKVIGVIPYFGYARQNIQHRPGECISANVIIRIIESIGFHRIYTIDIHDEATGGVFEIPFKNLSAFPALSSAIKNYLSVQEPDVDNFAIVTPDQGGIERARSFGYAFFGHHDFHLAVTEKKRDINAIHKSKALDLYGDVSGKTVILVDDIATSAGTLIHGAALCVNHGATRVLAAVTHHDFSISAPEKIQDSPIEVFFTTNSIALQEQYRFEKLREISIADIIANELRGLPV